MDIRGLISRNWQRQFRLPLLNSKMDFGQTSCTIGHSDTISHWLNLCPNFQGHQPLKTVNLSPELIGGF